MFGRDDGRPQTALVREESSACFQSDGAPLLTIVSAAKELRPAMSSKGRSLPRRGGTWSVPQPAACHVEA
jgi:hypothetical protein